VGRPRLWLGAAAMMLVLAACGGVPTSGAVHIAKALPGVGDQDDSTVRQLPPGPSTGVGPTGLVSGFLNALVDSDSNFGIARSFLAPDTTWSTSGSMVYDGNPVFTRVGSTRVDVRLDRLGTIDARGDYAAAPATVHVRFRLVRVDGQWRISRPPAGVLLSITDAQRLLQPVDIFYFNRDETQLVPDPVLVPPDQSGLATILMTDLLGPPRRSLNPAVTTAAPLGTTLIDNVPIDGNGVAEVDLSSAVQQAPADQLRRLLAQIVWTLHQVPSVTSVRVLANGSPLAAPGLSSLAQVSAFDQYQPDLVSTINGAIATAHGQVVGLSGASVPQALKQPALRAPVMSADGSTVAALRGGGLATTVLVGPSLGTLHVSLPPNVYSTPAFDPQGNVFVAAGVGATTTVIEVTRAGRVRPVEVPSEVLRQGIDAIAISRDGARVAMTVGPANDAAVMVGVITQVQGRPAIENVTLVIPASQRASGLVWEGANEIVTTIRTATHHRAVLESGVDGYQPSQVTSVGLPADPTGVAAAPGRPLLAVVGGEIWSFTSDRWQQLTVGADPAYPG
jgi:Lipoprotein LpqB beta-propeller domain/Sporulation and spore germination